MLELKNVHKTYSAGETEVRALRGIDLQFRKSEFVAILGPSGCGKTTMLNIIGGLDQYTKGDLLIKGVSTKNYGDREWDSYRNHSVGFVFQSYNLIPHQSVLANVEIALSLSGVGRRERRERARKALEQVGLGDQLRKKPSEMSGGQMQRVAIARALVNNPDIILADEPTGALDTETSVQVMDILKEISKERLVVMVTHNPELAETYATRIIRMLDGKITDDTMPLTEQELESFSSTKTAPKKKERLPSMSLWTSFSLSLQNLITKKSRTALTSFAGSIGIIGIALIYAVSFGVNAYIDTVQEDTLASYPLTLQATTVNISTLMDTFMGTATQQESHELDGVYSQSVAFDMFNAMNNIESTENDLNAFKQKVEQELKDPESELSKALSGVQYTYNFDLMVYTQSVDGKIILSDTEKLLIEAMDKNMNTSMASMMQMSEQMNSAMGMTTTTAPGMQLWNEMLSAKDGSMISPLLYDQYKLVRGTWPNSYDEIIIVVDENYEIDDMTLFALGLKPQSEMDAVFEAVKNGENIDVVQQKWSFQEIMAMEFRVVPNSQCFVYDEALGLFADLRETDAGLRYLYDNGIKLRVTGIITPNDDASSHMLTGTIGYTRALTEYVVEQARDSEAISTQLATPDTDIFTGLPFRDEGTMEDETKATKFREYIASLGEAEKAKAYIAIASIPSQEVLDEAVANALMATDRETMEEMVLQAILQQMSGDRAQIETYVKAMSEEELHEMFGQMVIAQTTAKIAAGAQQQFAAVPAQQLAAMLDVAMESYTVEQCAAYYDAVLEFAETTYDSNLTTLGYVDLEYPATMNLYASSFENKDVIEEFIADYNEDVEELKQIRYVDVVGVILSGITTVLNVITYVLIGFVGISLFVSSIMIGVITLISVQERTKEIGILRAIGASKGNVSSMFNAETVIIGVISGVLGIVMTYLLCVPINIIVQHLTGLSNLKAHLPMEVALILIAISVILTVFAGIIPSRSAAKKDPVVALRTE